MARDLAVIARARRALVELPRVAVLVDGPELVADALQLGSGAAGGAALVLVHHLELLRAVEHRARAPLARDIAIVARAGRAGVHRALGAAQVQVAGEEAAAARRGDHRPRPCGGRAG